VSDGLAAALVSFAAGLVTIALIGAITYSCTDSRRKYYEFANRCVSDGGAFVPESGSTYAMCISVRNEVRKNQ
jgi:hypothetical protein